MRLSEKILFLLEKGDEYFGDLGDLIDNTARFEWILGRSRRAVSRSLIYLLKKGELRRVGKRVVRFEVTQKGKNHVDEIRPELNTLKWDKKWRLVMFDIPEKYRGMRTVLRKFLVNLGFRQFQRSLWISARDVSRDVEVFIAASRLKKMAYLMHVDKLTGGIKPRKLADKLWGLEKLEEKYKALALECSRAEKLVKLHRLNLEKLIFSDPLVPKELLPKGFSRTWALKEYKALVDRSKR